MLKHEPQGRLKTKPRHNPVNERMDSASSEMGAINIRVRLRVQDEARNVEGMTFSIGPQCISFNTNYVMRTSTGLSLKFRVGAGLCYLSFYGQVISCIPAEDQAYKHQVRVRLAPIEEFEQRMLQSVLKEMLHDESMREKTLLTIQPTCETSTDEATGVPEETFLPLRSPLGSPHKTNSDDAADDPVWIIEMKRELKPYWDAVLESRIVQEASTGTLSLPRMQGWLIQLYPFIETFPKWIALTIARASDHRTRSFMIDNIRIEKRHAAQWVDMAKGFGITQAEMDSVQTLPEVDALTHWLWSVNSWGSLAEGVAATNYAVEGVTQGIAKLTVMGFPRYAKMQGLNLDKRAYAWMVNHARYDEVHPLQALEVIKMYTSRELQEKVVFAARRSLEYLFMALDACYVKYAPVSTASSRRELSSRSRAKIC